MASRKERFVGVFEFSVRAARHPDHPAELSPENFKKLHSLLKNKQKDGKLLSKDIEEGRLIICLDDMKIRRDKKIILLFTVVDADAADAVYRGMRSGKENWIKKGPDEGGAASAHLVIDLNAPTNVYRYRAGLEDIEGVSRSRIQPFLQELLRTACGSVSVIIEGEPYVGDAVVELQSVHGSRLTDAAGRPVGVELVRLTPRKKLDGPGAERYREVRKTIEFSIDRKVLPSWALEALQTIRKKQQDDFVEYPMMRIRWKRPDERIQTVRVDEIADDLMQRAFTRLELVSGFTTDLLSATKTIREDLANKMFLVLKN